MNWLTVYVVWFQYFSSDDEKKDDDEEENTNDEHTKEESVWIIALKVRFFKIDEYLKIFIW